VWSTDEGLQGRCGERRTEGAAMPAPASPTTTPTRTHPHGRTRQGEGKEGGVIRRHGTQEKGQTRTQVQTQTHWAHQQQTQRKKSQRAQSKRPPHPHFRPREVEQERGGRDVPTECTDTHSAVSQGMPRHREGFTHNRGREGFSCRPRHRPRQPGLRSRG
jgi:hypothetical protein